MDELSRAYYEVVFELQFLKKNGNEFQDFFSEIMEKCYPRDFQRVRPWGKSGDKKNDGYLKSQRTIYQVYAPNEMAASEAIAKIEEDFHGALQHWERHLDRWIFVHNSRKGLGPEVLQKLLTLQEDNSCVDIAHWGYEELRKKAFSLGDEEIAALLGPAPSRKDLTKPIFERSLYGPSWNREQTPLADIEKPR